MATRVQQWSRGTISRAILLSFLVIAILPISVVSLLFTAQSTAALSEQMEANLQALAQAKAAEINSHLEEVMRQTEVVAHNTAVALQQDVDPQRLAQQAKLYQPDHRNIIGLDVYYNAQGGEAVMGHNLSNVFWNHPVDDTVLRKIAQTESLNTIFEGIKSVSPDTQWIYYTSPEGMMRLYPWASNDNYPADWDPRQVVFYTVANPANNPKLEPQWTPPYVDFAGAGWMVTLSVPVIDDKSQFQGIVSHDITIKALKEIALKTNVLAGVGYGFLIDQKGGVIAHPDFEDQLASKGTEQSINILDTGSPDFRALVQRMINGETGLGVFNSERAGEQFLVYQPIPAIGWRLGIVMPRAVVIAPVIEGRNRTLALTAILIVLSVTLAVFLTRQIVNPLFKLMQGVHQISEEGRADLIQLNSFREFNSLAHSFNEMAAKVFQRHAHLQAQVNELTIKIDSRRRKEQLDSIVETDYFKHLEINAERLRNQLKNANTLSLGSMVAGGAEENPPLPPPVEPTDPSRP